MSPLHMTTSRLSLTVSSLILLFIAAIPNTVQAVSLPTCQTTAPSQKNLTDVRTASVSIPDMPFGLVYASQYHPHQHKDRAFVTIVDLNSTSSLGVLDTSSFAPKLIHRIALPAAYTHEEGATGIALTRDGKYVLVAAGEGAVVVDAAKAIKGQEGAVIGGLNGTVGSQRPGAAAIEVTISLDNEFAFVSQEYGVGDLQGNIDVFKLSLSKKGNASSIQGAAIGFLPLGRAVVGTTLSPDGKLLYAVSELAVGGNATSGQLSVIDVETLKTNPSQAQISNVTAGCGPVRVITSSDGEVVWVTARESNHLLAFNAKKLVSDPNNALLASVQVGTKPVGLTFARNETRILTADSNRSGNRNATTGLSVVDVKAALSGSSEAVLGRIPTGLFPREFAVNSNGSTILVADYGSKQIQAIDVASLP